jgi:hypothetical protein
VELSDVPFFGRCWRDAVRGVASAVNHEIFGILLFSITYLLLIS